MTRIRLFTPDQDLMLQQRNRNGESITTLAKVFGVGRRAITGALARAGGGKSRSGSYTFSVPQCDDLVRRNAAGEPVSKLAIVFGTDRATVSRAIRLRGGKPKYGPRLAERIVTNGGYAKVTVKDGDAIGLAMAHARTGTQYRPYVLEHRLVLARKLGRALLANETVHHKDGNRLNNNPANLELRVGPHGKGATEAHCRTCTCFHGVH